MADKQYAVVFRGDIQMGFALAKVKENLKKVFKVDDARIENLFSGKPIHLKRHLSLEQAQHYQNILKQAGAMVSITEAVDEKNKAAVSGNNVKSNIALPSSSKSTQQKQDQGKQLQEKQQAQWQLAPVGSLLFDTKQKESHTVDISVDHLSVLPQEGNLISDAEREGEAVISIDADALDWKLSSYGESLLKEESEKKLRR